MNRSTKNALNDLVRCLDCRSSVNDETTCTGCGRRYLSIDGLLRMIDPLSGRNAIAADFYEGPGWVRFRPWERLFLRLVGGERPARMEVLRHLPARPHARILEVGIGDGENVSLLPGKVDLFGVDIAESQLKLCRDRHPFLSDRLILAQAEKLPFADATFDAVYSIGGFNYFEDHAMSLREMKRVAKTDGVVVIADESPRLCRFTIGHWIGRPELTAWFLRRVGLDREFAAMAVESDFDVDGFALDEWPNHTRFRIWKRLGYCLIGRP